MNTCVTLGWGRSDPFTDAADALFLLAPETTGAAQAEAARASDPSCVIAIDYRYWLAHGNAASLAHRQDRLVEEGLVTASEVDLDARAAARSVSSR